MPNDIIIANVVQLKTPKVTQHGFTLQHAEMTIPGMRIYAGAIHPPMRQHGRRWFPMLHTSPGLAKRIWEAARKVQPDLVGPFESTLQFLELDDFKKQHYNLIAAHYREE